MTKEDIKEIKDAIEELEACSLTLTNIRDRAVFDELFAKKIDHLTFGEALEYLQKGAKVKRSLWNFGIYVALQIPDKDSKMNYPYIYLHKLDGNLPWIPTYQDIFSTDWEIKKD